jgi:TatA/E family protein of Tat protein translocase
MGLPNIGPVELIIVLVIALLVLGPGKLPEVGSAFGKTIKEFRKASSDITESVNVSTAVAPTPVTPVAPMAAATPAPVAPAAAPVAVAPVAVAPVAIAAPNVLADAVPPNTLVEAVPAGTPPTPADPAS